jgi:threonine/homoserine efflux transporter RhtA
MTDQEKALLEIGPTHTALMAVSILGTLVFIYQTEWAGHVSGLGVVFALLAAWASAAIEAQKRVKTGESTGRRLSAIPFFLSARKSS